MAASFIGGGGISTLGITNMFLYCLYIIVYGCKSNYKKCKQTEIKNYHHKISSKYNQLKNMYTTFSYYFRIFLILLSMVSLAIKTKKNNSETQKSLLPAFHVIRDKLINKQHKNSIILSSNKINVT